MNWLNIRRMSTDPMSIDEPLQGEEAIIRLLAPLARGAPGALGLEDDCALLTPAPGTQLVLKTDPVAEGVHFLPDDAPEDIAWKALAVNVSDLAAKAARPLGYLMALSFPEPPAAAWLTRFAAGLQAAQSAFGCHLLGGDTDRRPGPLTISITIIGEVEAGRMVRRATARPGEVLFVSGSLGDAALGLALRKDPALADRWQLAPAEAAYLRERYARPQPRLGLGPALRAHASAAMDISDGLAKDLARMCKASGCAAHVRLSDVPLSLRRRQGSRRRSRARRADRDRRRRLRGACRCPRCRGRRLPIHGRTSRPHCHTYRHDAGRIRHRHRGPRWPAHCPRPPRLGPLLGEDPAVPTPDPGCGSTTMADHQLR